MKLNDFIKIILFSVIGFILAMIGGYLSILGGDFSPYIGHVLGSFLIAPVVFVMCYKVHKRWTLFLFYLIAGIIYTVIGFWPMFPICIVVGVIAEILIGKVENYKNDKRLTITFVISELIMTSHGLIFLLILKEDGLVKQFPDMFNAEEVSFLSKFYLNPKNLLIVIAIQLIISYLGTRLGIYINRKFFAKNENKESLFE